MALLSLIPFKDWVYGGIIAALIAGGIYYTHHERVVGAAHEVAALKASSDKLNAQADAKVAQLTAQHSQEVTSIQETLNAQLKTASTLHASDVQRLREYDSYRHSNPSVGSAAAGSDADQSGTKGAEGSADIFDQLESVALDLATADREGSAALNACIADRNALTGK